MSAYDLQSQSKDAAPGNLWQGVTWLQHAALTSAGQQKWAVQALTWEAARYVCQLHVYLRVREDLQHGDDGADQRMPPRWAATQIYSAECGCA